MTDIALFRDAYAPLLAASAIVPCPCPERRTSTPRRRALDAHLARHHATTAALIVEPLVQGAAGMAMYDAAIPARARELCTRYGVHLVVDEIMTGFGRTGTMFACEQAGIAPDFLCLSKGITGGYLPLSCVLTTDEVYAAFYDDDVARGFLHSHSYTGNPLACRAALAVLDLFRDEDVIAANRGRARRWAQCLRAGRRACARAQLPAARHDLGVRGRIRRAPISRAGASPRRWRAGMLLRPIGRTVYFMPPYIVTDDELTMLVDHVVDILDRA